MAVAVAVSSSGHLAQVALNTCASAHPLAPRTWIFPPHSSCLATEVASLQKGLACSRSKCASFADAATLIGDGPCKSVVCVPLTDASAPPTLGLGPAPYGALTVAFRSGTISRDAALAVHALAMALAAPHCRLHLQNHIDTVVDAVLAPPHSLEALEEAAGAAAAAEPSTFSSPRRLEDHSAAGPSELPRLAAPSAGTCCAANDDDGDGVDTPPLQPPSPTCSAASSDSGWSAASGAHAAEEQHVLWMTFRSPAVERNFTNWAAMHMRHLDPAATLFSCSFFVALGVSPSFAMALRYPAAWAAGWSALIPMCLCLLPPTACFYLTHREICLAAFHAFSLAWHVATLNGTVLLGPSLFAHLGPSPAACLSWQAANLLMFQMRWWQSAVIAILMFATDVVAAAAPLCRLFDNAGIPQGPRCAATVVFVGKVQLIAALVVLRLNEWRMRRLYLEHLAEPPAKRRPKFWFLRRFQLLGGMPVAVEMPRAAEKAGWSMNKVA